MSELRVDGGSRAAAPACQASTNELMPMVYDQLQQLAAAYLRREGGDMMLEPAVLVNEAYLRLAARPPGSFHDSEHFFAVAAMAMRKVLIDQARQRRAQKRGGGQAGVSLELVTITGPREVDILEVDEALTALGSVNERASRIVELRFFAGLTTERVARILGVSRKTVDHDWSFARKWLADALSDNPSTEWRPA